MPDFSTILIALLLTLLAGLSTGIGAMISFFTRHTDTPPAGRGAGAAGRCDDLYFLHGANAGSLRGTGHGHARADGRGCNARGIFRGIGLIALIDWLVPADENPHEAHSMEELTDGHSHHKMKRTGIMLAMAIGIHNFPEGMATFISALDGPRNGTADRHSHSHTQYSGGDSRVGADLPLYGQPAQGFFLFALCQGWLNRLAHW